MCSLALEVRRVSQATSELLVAIVELDRLHQIMSTAAAASAQSRLCRSRSRSRSRLSNHGRGEPRILRPFVPRKYRAPVELALVASAESLQLAIS